MPYIDSSSRGQFDEMLVLLGDRIETAGEFNYCVSVLAKKYLEHNGKNYQHMNDLMGALEGIKLELYRRTISDYEDQKMEENGDF